MGQYRDYGATGRPKVGRVASLKKEVAGLTRQVL